MIRRPPLLPTDPRPWGQHKGTAMRDLPIAHLVWLRDQPWLLDWPEIYAYVQTRQKEIEAAEVHPEDEGGPPHFSTYEEYLRSARR